MGNGLKMGRLDFKWDSILRLLFNYPAKEFQVRELSRLSKVPKTTVQRVLKILLKQEIILLKKKGFSPVYGANETFFWYKFYKKYFLLEEVYASGLTEYLESSFHPRCIFLFGSGAKGEYTFSSDLDIFLLSSEKKAFLDTYERKLGRKVNLLFKENIQELSPELFNNIINGVKLGGYLKIR